MNIVQRLITAKHDVPQLLFVLNRLDCDYPNAACVAVVYKNTGAQIGGDYVYEYKGVILQ